MPDVGKGAQENTAECEHHLQDVAYVVLRCRRLENGPATFPLPVRKRQLRGG